MKIKYLIAFLLSMLCGSSLFSQHYQFSQFYSAPTYLNPAFTGANACGRFSMNYRKQWSGIPGTFTSYQMSFDHFLPNAKSGIGLQFFSDQAGLGYLNTTAVNGLYAYETKVNRSIMARAGLSLGFVQRKVDWSSFTFADQIARGGQGETVETINNEGLNYLDVGAGGLMYSKESWIGFSVAHLNKPNQSLLLSESVLPMEFKFHGGYRFVFRENENSNRTIPVRTFVTAAFNFKHQNNFNQLDFGIYFAKDMLNIGVWYRGIPAFEPVPGYQNNDAVVILFGIAVEKLKIGYSYDYTLSDLSNAVSRGTHEISASYQFCKMKKPRYSRKRILISCPKF